MAPMQSTKMAVCNSFNGIMFPVPEFDEPSESWSAHPIFRAGRDCLSRIKPHGFKISFCTRQFKSSAAKMTFSEGHDIE